MRPAVVRETEHTQARVYPCPGCKVRVVSSGFCVACQSQQRAARGLVPRPELPVLATISNADERLFLLFYLRSNIEKDQDEARKRCDLYGIDYTQARLEAGRT